jgi:hypothetical protein
VIAPLDGVSKAVAMAAVTTYWGKRGLDGCLPEKVAQAMQLGAPSSVAALAVVLAHAALGTIAALAILSWQGRRRRG